MHGEFVTRVKDTFGVLRELDNLTANQEEGGLLLGLVEEVVQLRAKLGRAIIVLVVG